MLIGVGQVIDVILLSLGPLTNVFLLSCMMFFVFGIGGIQLFQGHPLCILLLPVADRAIPQASSRSIVLATPLGSW